MGNLHGTELQTGRQPVKQSTKGLGRLAQVREFAPGKVPAQKSQATIRCCDQPLGINMVQRHLQTITNGLDRFHFAFGDRHDAQNHGGALKLLQQLEIEMICKLN